MKKVAIIVQPHQQISNSKNRKYGGVERVVTSLIEGLLDRNVDVTLYTAKECRLDCAVRYPIGIFDGVFGDKTERIELSLYSQKVREDLETEDFDVVHNHYDPVTFVTLQGLGIPIITTLHGPGTEENVNIYGRFFESSEVNEIWVTFPDPRPKKGDAKRRFTHPRFMEIYRRLLKAGGSGIVPTYSQE